MGFEASWWNIHKASANLEREFIARFEPLDVWGKASNPVYDGSMDNKHPYQDTRNEHETRVFSNFQASSFFKVLSRTQENTLKS